MAPPQATQHAQYAKDEKVLCFHGELLYEAKILDSKHTDTNDKKSPILYFVHYKGWKNTWDDWVSGERVRKLTEENKELAKTLKRDLDAARKPAPSKTSNAKRRVGGGSDNSSIRGSEERQTSLPATGRGKRGRDDLDKGYDVVAEEDDVVAESLPIEATLLGALESLNYAATMEGHTPGRSPKDVGDSAQTAHSRSFDGLYSELAETLGLPPDEPPPRSSLNAPILTQYGHRPYVSPYPPVTRPHVTSGSASGVAEIKPVTEEEAFLSRPEIRIPVPDHLKSILVDDWENVTKNLLLVALPSKHPANQVLDDYYDEEKLKRRDGSAESDVLDEVIAGLKEYFSKCLGRILLYRFEREQYAEKRRLWEQATTDEWEGKGPGDVYGAEHLTRLIVTMPELIAQTNMDAQAVHRLREEMSKICLWLAKHASKYFTGDYETAPPEYVEKARGIPQSSVVKRPSISGASRRPARAPGSP